VKSYLPYMPARSISGLAWGNRLTLQIMEVVTAKEGLLLASPP
jgi:hypothetical protein